jgi:uncharacterized membrane protein
MKLTTLVVTLAAGAGLMYVLDPERGKRRRALLRDQLEHARHSASDAGPARDLLNRTRGVFGELRYRLNGRHVDDEVLVERVRSRIGRAVRYASSIEVEANDGEIRLRGPVLRENLERLVRSVSSVPGVKEVDDESLDVYEQQGDIPGLQGMTEPPRTGGIWSPSARAAATLAGAGVALFGFMRGGLFGLGLMAGGLALAARGITNLETKRLFGVGAGRRAVDFHKTIVIDAPLERVFELWSDYENFPRFMSNVREVSERGRGRSHWVVGGPLGVPVEWDAVTTRYEPNELIAWKTVEGSTIEHAGVVGFDPEDGGTRVDVRLSYNPIAGAAGHAVAALFHSDPKKQMDEDLMRMKAFIETDKAPRDTQRPQPVAARSGGRASRAEGERNAADVRDETVESETPIFTQNPEDVTKE